MNDSIGESFPPAPPTPFSPPSDNTSLAEISSWWEVPCIAHFCHIFSDALELPTFDIEEFEIALLPSETDKETHPLIVNLHVTFLKGILEKKEIGPSNWELLLRLHFVWRNEFLNEKYNPMGEVSYNQLSTRTKVEMLYKLCHLRMELDDVTECIKNLEPYEMRLEEVGVDRGGNKLWYFYGLRLYRESKEAQQHNKRLRSRPADSQKKETVTASSSKSKNSTPRNRNKKDRCEPEENCVSAEDSCRQQDSKRVTRSAILTSSKPVNTEDLDIACNTTRLTCSHLSEHKNTLVMGENEFSSRTGWSIVCADMKDWSKFLSSLENSPHDSEVEFVRYVKRELVDTLTELDHDKKADTILTMSDSSRRVSNRLINKLRPDYTSEQIDFSGVPECNKMVAVETKVSSVEESVVSENDSVDADLEEEREKEREEIKEKRELEWQEAYSGT
eukprot:TRINITY_DN2586_c1_g1_i6.p1 TRINITY_DN2586_c1_g1~~TRINITY_DN2586_c1_g1_i6.p1  ORF type:complete len:446 (+),score=116.78 TRINITY_DN2586_c1_g1_i6:133-1470(+)